MAGYMTGLVVTTDITDATPACFASHVKYRLEEDLIAQQEVGEHPLGRGEFSKISNQPERLTIPSG